jgi:SH3-like domain-containing protein
MLRLKIFVLLFYLIISTEAIANETGILTGLPIPRYVSLKSNEIKIRIGPGKKYQTSHVYECINYPVKIIAEFDNWRKIEDINQTQGWVHQSLLSGARYVIITDNEFIIRKDLINKLSDNQSLIFKAPDENSPPILKIEFGVLAKIMKCEKFWCKVIIQNYKGWIRKANIWGVE